jgi:hydrogenase expression/formation protein HypC
MCIAVPGKVIEVGEASAISIRAMVSTPAGDREIDLVMVPEARVGDYVVTHSGYAIRLLPEEEALALLEVLAEGTR